MPNQYQRIVANAQSAFLRRVRAARTQSEVLDVAITVAQEQAGIYAGSAERAMAVLADNPSLVLRRLPDSERFDCETIADVVAAFLEHDLSRELEPLVQASQAGKPEGGN